MTALSVHDRPIRLAAVGDLLFVTKPWDPSSGRGLESLAPDTKELLSSCDIVFANLECTLPGPEKVPTEPRVICSEGQIRSLVDAGVHVVTLANNHAFDCMEEGFHRLRAMLADLGVSWFGAGDTLKEALEPAVVDVQGESFAFVGAVDPSTGPCRFAGESASGVPLFEAERMCTAVAELKARVDHVIVSLHWGRERFRMPSPIQIQQAHALIEAGADMILGHHAHVLQGLEIYAGAPIAYSLGNFLTNNVYWSNGDFLTWSRFERTGCLVVAEFNSTGPPTLRQVPTFDDGEKIRIEESPQGRRRLAKVNGFLAHGVTPERYQREAFRVNRIHPVLSRLRWSNIRRLRPRHFTKALGRFYSSGR
jgi:poly-gamma-glutamate synthesis protein (capsule biosynthesis protein)